MQGFWDHGVQDFDVIGISYYWQFHNVLFEELGNAISDLKNNYPGKAVMIFETAYPWTSSNSDGANNILSTTYPGYSPFTPARQKQWLTDMTQTVIDHGGSGVIYWEPGWVSTGCWTQYGHGSNWDNATFFDFNANLQESGGVGWMAHPYDFTSATTEIHPATDSLQIYQAGHEIIIQRENELQFEGVMNISFYSLDGKRILRQTIHPAWQKNILHLPVPELTPGCFMVSLVTKDQLPVNRLFVTID